MSIVRLDHAVPLLQQARGQNDCGPHAAAMAIGFFQPSHCDPQRIAQQIRYLRIPRLGATLPWAIGYVVRLYGLLSDGGFFATLDALKKHVAANHPVVVIAKPTDFTGCPWYALHYRVIVGYREDPAVPGGGDLYFNCSALPHSNRPEPGNLTLDYHSFRLQWRTYLTYNWALAIIDPSQQAAFITKNP